MPAFSTITLNDGQATPVAHSFSPNVLNGELATYQDRVGGIALGYPVVSLTSTEPNKNSRVAKVRAKLVVPVLETVTGSSTGGFAPAPTRAYDLTADMTFFLPERSTLAQRKDILAYAKNLLSNAIMTNLVETQDKVY